MTLAVFAAGIAAAVAVHDRLYANAALAVIAGLWLSLLSLADPPAVVALPPPPASPALLAEQTELRRLRFMLDHAPVPLVSLATDRSLRAVNKAARRLFGTDDRILGDAALASAITAATPGQSATVRLAEPASADGRVYALSVAHWSTGAEPAVLAALADVQAEVQTAEANALRDVLQTLSHEIMNSLTPVMSLAETVTQLLAERGAAGLAEAQEAVETIARRARGLDRFVQGYRALARVPAPVPRATSVGELLHDVGLLFANRWRAERVALTLVEPRPDIIATIDPDLIGQALMTLLTNGAEAALAADQRPATVTLSATAEGGRLQLRVSDSGAGVADEIAGRIFQPLFTSKAAGTGIGLGIARQIALGHGGRLVLEAPQPGAGAAFRIEL
jgi:two-component system nitrogen regulation sensor histidine kinase NtrY